MELAAITPIGPHEVSHLRDAAYRRLRQAILDGSLPSDTRLNERDLARALAISTTPIKDALRRLEAEGLTTTLPRRGTYVTCFAPAVRRELTLARVALEGVAARLAAERIADSRHRQAIVATLGEIRACTARHDLPALVVANESLHDAIHAVAGSEYIARLLGTLRIYSRHARLKVLSKRSELPNALAEHTAIAEAVLRGDPDGAEAAMRAHVMRSGTAFEASLGNDNSAKRRAPNGRKRRS